MAGIFSGNGIALSYNTDLNNRKAQVFSNIQINEINTFPVITVQSESNSYETYDSDYNSKLLGDKNVSSIAISVNYIPDDSTHNFLDEAALNQTEFQLTIQYKLTDEEITYSQFNGVINSTSLTGDKDSVVSKEYQFTPTEVISTMATIAAAPQLYTGDFGVGSNGTDIPQITAVAGNSFIKVPSSEVGNPAGSDMLGVGLIDGTSVTSLAITKSGSLSIFAKNDSTAWQRIYTSTQADGRYVPLERTINGYALSDNVTLSSTDTGSVPTERTINGYALSSDVSLVSSDVGLGNVSNDPQLKVSENLGDLGDVAEARANLDVYSQDEIDSTVATVNLSITTLSDSTTSQLSDLSTEVSTISDNLSDTNSNLSALSDSTSTDITNINTAITTLSDSTDAKILEINSDIDLLVPQTRTINGHDLSQDVVITPSDIDVYTKDEVDTLIGDATGSNPIDTSVFALKSTTINGHDLSTDITLTKSDISLSNVIDELQLTASNNLSDIVDTSIARSNIDVYSKEEVQTIVDNVTVDTSALVPKTTTINGHDLSTDITLTSTDISLGNVTNDAQLKISSNLSDLGDLATARTNLNIDRVYQSSGTTYIASPTGQYQLALDTSGLWGVYDATNKVYKPLAITQGGTGATTVVNARINLGIDSISQSTNVTTVKSGDSSSALAIYNGGQWGSAKYDTTGAFTGWTPLAIAQGGTGATDATTALQNLGVPGIGSINGATAPANANSITINGIYAGAGDSGTNWGDMYAPLLHMARYNTGTVGQLQISSNGTLYVRGSGNGGTTWNDWREHSGIAGLAWNGNSQPYTNSTLDFNNAPQGWQNINGSYTNSPYGNNPSDTTTATLTIGALFTTSPSGLQAGDLNSTGVDDTYFVQAFYGSTGKFYTRSQYKYANGGPVTFGVWNGYQSIPSSDARIKTVQGELDLSTSLDNINRMDFVNFTFDNDEDATPRRGVIAQQIIDIDPEYVTMIDNIYHLDTTPMMLDGLAAIKALSQEIEVLKQQIQDLLNK